MAKDPGKRGRRRKPLEPGRADRGGRDASAEIDYDAIVAKPLDERETDEPGYESGAAYGTHSRGRVLPEFRTAISPGRLIAEAERRKEERLLDAWFGEYGTSVSRALFADPARRAEKVAEVVIGEDDRRRVAETETYPYSSVCSLLITAANGGRYIGTGWLVGPRTVITAGHCVYLRRQGGWVRKAEVMPGRDDGEIPAKTAATQMRSVTGWVHHGRPEQDYGAILLDEPLGEEFGWFGYGFYEEKELYAMTVNVVGYPGDKPAGTMWGHARRVKRVNPNTLSYDIDTYGGNSGAPVIHWDEEEDYIVTGIHNYGDLAGNSATRITSSVFDNIKRWKGEGAEPVES